MRAGELWRRIEFLIRGRQFDAEMDEELRFHAAMKADAYRADGADTRYAFRVLRKSPAITLVAVLKALPIADAARVYFV